MDRQSSTPNTNATTQDKTRENAAQTEIFNTYSNKGDRYIN